MANYKIAGMAGLGIGLIIAAGCKSTRSDNFQGFGSIEPDIGTVTHGDNPMPAALTPEQPGNVIYPEAQPPKAPEYWEQVSDPYAGLAKVPSTGAAPASYSKTTPVATAGYDTYIVQKGDTFGGIAQKKHVSLKSLKAANPGVNYDKIKVGQKIAVPAGAAASATKSTASATSGVYVVQKGDILGRIARQHGVKIADLKAANGLTSDKIVVGQKLKIPGKSAASGSDSAAKSIPAQTAKIEAPKVTAVENKKQATPKTVEVAPPSFGDFSAPAVPAPAVFTPAVEVTAPAIETKVSVPEAASTTTYLASGSEDLYSIAVSKTVALTEILRLNPELGDDPGKTLPAGTPVVIPVK